MVFVSTIDDGTQKFGDKRLGNRVSSFLELDKRGTCINTNINIDA